MIIKEISEDGIDLTIRELLESEGWKTAYYSPPCGSWSIIQFEIDDKIFRSFSPRDANRPDLILYKKEDKDLFLILVESKEKISSFYEEKIKDYIKNMNNYLKEILKMKYRHKKENEIWYDWNKSITNIEDLNINYLILFISGSKPLDLDNEFKKMVQLSKKFEKNKENIGFSLVSINFQNLKNKIRFVYNKDNFLSKKFDKEIDVDYSTLQK